MVLTAHKLDFHSGDWSLSSERINIALLYLYIIEDGKVNKVVIFKIS